MGDFDDKRAGTGTMEWAETTENIAREHATPCTRSTHPST